MSHQQIQISPLVAHVHSKMPNMLSAIDGQNLRLRQRFQQAALAVANDGNLQQCTPESLYKCLVACARLNLVPDPMLKLAYIVRFGTTAQLIIGYPGLLELAFRAAPDLNVWAGCVFDNDEYSLVDGTKRQLVITEPHWIRGEEPGKMLFAYCISQRPGGDPLTSFVPAKELEKLKEQARAKGVGPGRVWTENFQAMCEKTAIRRQAKLWRLSPEAEATHRLREAIEIDEMSGEDLPSGDGASQPAGVSGVSIPDESSRLPPAGSPRVGKARRAVQSVTVKAATENIASNQFAIPWDGLLEVFGGNVKAAEDWVMSQGFDVDSFNALPPDHVIKAMAQAGQFLKENQPS